MENANGPTREGGSEGAELKGESQAAKQERDSQAAEQEGESQAAKPEGQDGDFESEEEEDEDEEDDCECDYPDAKPPGEKYFVEDLPLFCVAQILIFMESRESVYFEGLCTRVEKTLSSPQSDWCSRLVLDKIWRRLGRSNAVRTKWFPRFCLLQYIDHCKCHPEVEDLRIADLAPLFKACRHTVRDIQLTYSCLKTTFAQLPCNWRVVPDASASSFKRLERLCVKTIYGNETAAAETMHALQHFRFPACRRLIFDGCLLTSNHVLNPVMVCRALQAILTSCQRLTHLVLKDFEIEETPVNSAPASRRSLTQGESVLRLQQRQTVQNDFSDWFLNYQAWQYGVALDFVLAILTSVPLTAEHMAISYAFQVDALLSALWQLKRTKQPLPTPPGRMLIWSVLGSMDIQKAQTAISWIDANAPQLYFNVENLRVFSGDTWPPAPFSVDSFYTFLASMRLAANHITNQLELPFSNLTESQNGTVGWSNVTATPIVFPFVQSVMLTGFNPHWPSHTLMLPLLRFSRRDKTNSRLDLKVRLAIPALGSQQPLEDNPDPDAQRLHEAVSEKMEDLVDYTLKLLARQLSRHADLRTANIKDIEFAVSEMSPKMVPLELIAPHLKVRRVESVFSTYCPSAKVEIEKNAFQYRLSVMSFA
eukprot:GHVN01089841.1.p1 GENE.GHVN01089841.1~~GHVN01089841.1.p1  ORF type:complete len:650 (+),score=59.93 GHVN01089841.1:78-2027(+)